MKFIYKKNLKSHAVSTNPTTLNLQTRPFAPHHLDTSQDDNTGISSPTYTKRNSSENLLDKLISSSNSEPSTKPIQSKPYTRLAAVRAQRMGTAIQAKLNIGAPNDKYEKEADATAIKVVKQINTPSQEKSVQRQELIEDEDQLQMKPEISSIQRQESIEEEKEDLQMKSLVQRRENIAIGDASQDLESSIQRAKGSGQPLDPNLQTKMGQVMGSDFSRVKIHTDAQSDQLNQSIQAKAFTTGQDVFFSQGAYNPKSKAGQELIAHELTHVVQQDSNQSIQRKIDFKPEKLSGMVSTKAKIASTFTADGLSTLQRIKLVLKEYSKINDPKVEANMLAFLKSQSELWLAQHKYTKTKKGRQKTALIDELLQSVIAEQASIARAENYNQDLKDNKFQFLTPGSKDYRATDDQSQHPAADLAKKYGLLEGEMRAIRMYAGNEYIYINPIIADNDAWLNSQLSKYLDMHRDYDTNEMPEKFRDKNTFDQFSNDEQARFKEEAHMHADVAVSGLKKLPNIVKQCFRGLGLSEAEFRAQYEDKVGQTINFPSFSSTSRDILTAKGFAEANSRAQGRVGILLKMNVKFGKDINKISGAGESEVLLLPNAQFKIDTIEDSADGYKEVVVTQVA
ncbi:eCIS core domain-containing protein [Pseudanabaena minima]|uniref:eCIS core domain-containing protein n=1 Tax=Pseudanabaena minima TaxID=890415 RepID=UPI003DA83155